MTNPVIVDILVRRILEGGINSATNQPMKLEDIKIEEYRVAVENEILKRSQTV
ncbi:hypothetical protein [Anoxybacillus flavithermus]|uniref:Uncharacterized protein n=1 Tax=Anoxybacillus flavithermus TaxID=33934 RepID=A0A178TFX3_9BACL|nr:hypothetical protein [Anoxybacillus flavithermus]OAO79812.1 hypothetical protein TAF16_1323 [Anoxybacillus flavithermus]